MSPPLLHRRRHAMNGMNSAGQIISLLNTDHYSLTIAPPSTTPPTPLLRSYSSDSAYVSSVTSPTTPHFEYPQLRPSPYKQIGPLPATYEGALAGNGSMSLPSVSNGATGNTSSMHRPIRARQSIHSGGTRPKNRFPCPVASQFHCDALFTTSGHAGRHSKTHLGLRDVQCPECPRTFTRKDNMEQHRRTHRNKRNTRNARANPMNDGSATRIGGGAPSHAVSPPTRASQSLVDPALSLTSAYNSRPAPGVQLPPPSDFHRSSYPSPEHYQLAPTGHPDDVARLHVLANAAHECRDM